MNGKRIAVGKDSKGEQIIVRRAAEIDFESVLDINREVYDGLDYLPDMYHMYLQDGFHAMYVVELNNTVVSFAVFGVSPSDDREVVSMALRTHADYQGRGLSAYKNLTLRGMVRDDFPNVQYELHTRYTHGSPLQEPGSDILLEWKVLGYRILQSDKSTILSQCLKQMESKSLNCFKLDYSASQHLLSKTDSFERFFLERGITYLPFGTEWKPAETCKLNLRHLMLISDTYVSIENATSSSETSQENNKYLKLSSTGNLSDEINEFSEPVLHAVSFRYVVLIGKNANIDIYFYGDWSHAKDHFSAQINDVMSFCRDHSPIIAFHFSKDEQFDEVIILLNELGFKEERLEDFFNRMSVFMTKGPF